MFQVLSDKYFQLFKDIIYNESGIHFSDINRPVLESRLRERARVYQMDGIEEYYDLIISVEPELRLLLDSVTTNLTRFFRNSLHFETFSQIIIPEILARKKSEKFLRIWSAGCSTGEEPYSLAMVMEDLLSPGWTYEIVASDLSFGVLTTAKEGFYIETRVDGIPENYLNKYFIKEEKGYKVIDSIKKNIRFDYHNLKNESGLRGLDIIFCRNVIIYFDRKAQEAVVKKFYNALKIGGYLFLGHSESLFGMDTPFKFYKTAKACIYRKQED